MMTSALIKENVQTDVEKLWIFNKKNPNKLRSSLYKLVQKYLSHLYKLYSNDSKSANKHNLLSFI